VVGGQRDATRGVQRGGALVRASSKIEDKLTRGDVGATCQGTYRKTRRPEGVRGPLARVDDDEGGKMVTALS
jgi:hypothetical protein